MKLNDCVGRLYENRFHGIQDRKQRAWEVICRQALQPWISKDARVLDLGGGYAQFLLVAELGMMVRDVRKIVSLLWYKDMGEIKLVDKQKIGFWQSLIGGGSGGPAKCALEIYRSNGTLFTTISGQAEESVKRVLYDFLERRKELAQL